MVQVQSQLVSCSYIHSCVYIEFEVQQTGVCLSSCDSPSSMYVSGTDSSGTGNFDNPCTAFNARISLVWCWAKLDHKHCNPMRDSSRRERAKDCMVSRHSSRGPERMSSLSAARTLASLLNWLFRQHGPSIVPPHLELLICDFRVPAPDPQFHSRYHTSQVSEESKNRGRNPEILDPEFPLLTNPSFMVAPLRGTR